MELNIGPNIKRLRLAKGLTQEQLADLLRISTAAVSKWEARNTYPDITMLFPLAEIFGVSVDELLGYDEARSKAEIDGLLAEYQKLHLQGCFAEASAHIAQARKKYPHDYRIMSCYMWDKAGGTAGNDPALLLQYRDELTQLCNCILDGCTQDNLRAGAINMKAKLLHAGGDTEGALEMLTRLPRWDGLISTEALFAKDTAEYRTWNRRNCYGLMDVMALRLARTVRFDPSLSTAEKITQLEIMGNSFSEMSRTPSLACLCIAEQAVYAIAAGMLTAEDPIEDVIRMREKQFAAMKKLMHLAERDEVLRESIRRTYKSDDMLAWELNRLLTSPHHRLAALREYPAYVDMLKKYETS